MAKSQLLLVIFCWSGADNGICLACCLLVVGVVSLGLSFVVLLDNAVSLVVVSLWIVVFAYVCLL